MTTREQRYAAASRRGERYLWTFGEEVKHARIALGISQRDLGTSVRMSQSKVCRLEAARLRTLTFLDAARIAAAVGLDLFVKVYPNSRRPRDAASMRRLSELLSKVAPPLSYRTEAGLPPSNGPYPEQRAWDAMIEGGGEVTAVELEISLYDLQAQTRRIFLKQQDGKPDHLLIVVADTRTNRRVLKEGAVILHGFPILRRRDVIASLRAGRHPTTGIVLF